MGFADLVIFGSASFAAIMIFSIPFWVFGFSFLAYLSIVFSIQVWLFRRIRKEIGNKKSLPTEVKEFLAGSHSMQALGRYMLSGPVFVAVLLLVWVPIIMELAGFRSPLGINSAGINEIMLSTSDGIITILVIALILALFMTNNLYYYARLRKKIFPDK